MEAADYYASSDTPAIRAYALDVGDEIQVKGFYLKAFPDGHETRR